MAVILVGDGELAVRLIALMESRGDEVVFVTPSAHDAEEFALAFPRTLVLHGDARDPSVLGQARAGSCSALIAATDDDAANLSVCLLAREAFGVSLTLGLASHPHNVRVFEATGVPCISCSEIVAEGVMDMMDGCLAVGERV